MKTQFFFLFSFFLVGTFFSSCNKDEEGIKNEFTYDSKSFSLDKGFIEEYGSNGNGSFDFDVYLFSEGITIDEALHEPIGKGHGFYFDLNSPVASGLAEGKYTYSQEREAFNYVEASAIINADISLDTGEEIDVKSGDIDISFNGDKTIIKFDFLTTENKALVGEFEGVLKGF